MPFDAESRHLETRNLRFLSARRFFRIAPLYYVGIALYASLSAFYAGVGTPDRYNGDYSATNIFANLFLIHGLYLPANNNIVPGGWSIGCGVLFYALFSYLFMRIRNEVDCRKFIAFALIFNALIQLFFASALEKPVTVGGYPFLSYFFINQLPVFGFGMLLYFSLQKERRQPLFYLGRCGFFFALTALFFHFASCFPLTYAWLPTLAALSFFYLGHFLSARTSSGFLCRVLAGIGRRSYSIYIFHFLFAWNLLGTTSYLLNFSALRFPAVAWTVLLAFNLALSYALAVASGPFIENVGIEWGRQLMRRLGLGR
ncbi:Acyltransferase family protein [Abditibacterium utsteinense]|uniref:Acyltransferase family protein n=1 Tax=Abditibacterium utsteinense TaxID=1960156 RepID=A0A2S8SWQ8_9BACT|nr:acyltransferase family protein [Abditibacterium utsteinense]PQV65231.1 Acyltransferase family protein [Abditibacterium utsteinense]